MTIFLTTQYLEEADQLADMISIIDHGKIVKSGSPAVLKASLGSESLNLAFDSRETAERAENLLRPLAERTQVDRVTVRVYMDDVARQIPAIIEKLHAAGLDPVSLTLTQPTLDDVFLQVTGTTIGSEEAATDLTEPAFA
jgi:ABC-2 type transport system ATP-binding protein